MTSVAVVVPTWRRPDELRRCLRALRDQSRPPDRVLVVRRPEDEETAAVLSDSNGMPVEGVLVHDPGQVAALNAGLRAAREDVVAITDDDAVPRPGWIERIVDYFRSDPGLGAVGGRDWLHQGGEFQDGAQPVVGTVAWYGRFIPFHHLGDGGPREVDFLKGVNMSFRGAALDGVSFDTGLRGTGAEYHNDTAISFAVKRAGWRVMYDPAVAVDHYEGPRRGSQGRIRTGGRSDADRAVASNMAYNETYVAMRYLPLPRALMHLVFALVLGTTNAPGPGIAAVRMSQVGGPRAAVVEVFNSLRARVGGAAAGTLARIRDARQ